VTVSARTLSFSPSSVRRWISSAEGLELGGGTAAGALGGCCDVGVCADVWDADAFLRPATLTDALPPVMEAEPSLVALTEP